MLHFQYSSIVLRPCLLCKLIIAADQRGKSITPSADNFPLNSRMLAEYPPDYSGTCVQVQLQSPSVSKWPPADGLIRGEDATLLDGTECSSALYYESFEDGSFYGYDGCDEDEDDDIDDLESFFPPSAASSFDSSESNEKKFEIPVQSGSQDDICGSAGSDYLRSTFISILPELSLDESMSLSTVLPVECPLPSPPLNSALETEEVPVSISCVEEVIPSESPRGERKRKLTDVNWNDMSTSQKQSMIETLLMTMSASLGPREKLEVSRILGTDGDISSVSYELSIDAENLSEDKLARIQELIEESTEESFTCKKREFKQGRSKVKNDLDNPNFNKRSKSQKKSESADRSNHLRVSKERQRKECKQNIKEKRSGLFQQEEVISLYCDGSSDEEIDILE